MENVYVGLGGNDNAAGCIYSGAAPQHVTFDKVFIDIPATEGIYKVTQTSTQNGSNTSLTIKNSLFRNYNHSQWRFTGSKVVAGDVKTITIDNNIFINSQFRNDYNGLVCYYPDAFTSLVITNNYVYHPKKTAVLSTSGASTAIEGAPFTFKVTGNKFFNLEGVKQFVDNKGFTAESVIDNNYTQLVGTDYGTKFVITGADLAKTWLIAADGSNTSSMIQPFTFNGTDVAASNTITIEADAAAVDLEAYFANETVTSNDNENTYYAYSDVACDETSALDINAVTVAAAGSKVYVKVASPDATTVGDTVYEIIINRKVAYTVENEAKGSELIQMYNGQNYYWVGWQGNVEGTGTAAADITNSRVGTIFLSDTTNLETMKADIEAAVAEMTSADEISTIIATINADDKYSTGDAANTIKAYTMSDDNTKALTWSNEAQSYGYRYNFGIIEGKYRATVMFAVYKDSDGKYQVTFSNMVVQQAGAELAQ